VARGATLEASRKKRPSVCPIASTRNTSNRQRESVCRSGRFRSARCRDRGHESTPAMADVAQGIAPLLGPNTDGHDGHEPGVPWWRFFQGFGGKLPAGPTPEYHLTLKAALPKPFRAPCGGLCGACQLLTRCAGCGAPSFWPRADFG
jgi:hypothetical protein